MVAMLAQCAPMSISDVIKILRQAKKTYGDIPVAGHNGEGFHISVERSDKDLKDLSTTFSYGYKRKIGPGAYRYTRKKNPSTLYIWFWD